jgi:NAD(P)-dependent dehydrogenase (short-subunit alcohol dehydrogenase family)
MKNMKSTQKKTVLITGASTGFGNLTTRRLLQEGYKVFASMRNPQDRNRARVEELVEHAQGTSGELTVLDIDVSDNDSIAKGVATVLTKAGGIDVLINNAGQAYMGPFEAFSDEQLRQQFDVNFFGPAALNRAVLPGMRDAGQGLIVHVSSGLGRAVFPGTGVYSASKFALEAMSEAIRYEASAFGVDSVTIEPGAFDTGITGSFVEPERRTESEAYGPLSDTGENMRTSLDAYFQSGGGDPQEVVSAILNAIETEPENRPARVAVGADVNFVTAINESALPHQREGMRTFGMEAFEGLAR